MCKLLFVAVLSAAAMPAQSQKYGVGRAATPEEVKAWDISVAPDGWAFTKAAEPPCKARTFMHPNVPSATARKAREATTPPLVGGRGTLHAVRSLSRPSAALALRHHAV